jgi:2-polyprenyl-3-methyl-5-hydroxy-6-metoxy-1,4-benzoquinol methylase
MLPDVPAGVFDAVISTSVLHHLHDPTVLWTAMARAAAPDAPLFVHDLRRPESPEIARSMVDAYAADEPEVLRRDFYHSLCAAFTADEVREQTASLGLTVEEVGDRHLLAYGRFVGSDA